MASAATAALLVAGCTTRQAPAADEVVVFRLSGASAAAPEGAAVYLAGSFNDWNPADSAFRLARQRDGSYALTRPLPEQARGLALEFKFTLGSWDAVETDAAGADVANRLFVIPAAGPVAYTGTVVAWRDPRTPRPPVASTASASVAVLSEQFAMPQLDRTRRIWIYLPPDYATSQQRYPVLYMHDGQNLFDAATSYAGEWGVDETLDSLHARGDLAAIVVGIDNGQQRRFDEYSPWSHPEGHGGDGDAYVDFLVHTLKPYIDARFRTRPERAHTSIAGSSMGGVISLYAALKHPEVFGSAGVFSPALWVTPQFYDYARAFDGLRPRPRLYFGSGALEGSRPRQYVEDQDRMVRALASAGFEIGADVEALVREDGTHTEAFWRREFPAAYLWLFPDARPTDAAAVNPQSTADR
jgi:predicted alpha/beta superfamily hydrolase